MRVVCVFGAGNQLVARTMLLKGGLFVVVAYIERCVFVCGCPLRALITLSALQICLSVRLVLHAVF